jgi:hypothetical protein
MFLLLNIIMFLFCFLKICLKDELDNKGHGGMQHFNIAIYFLNQKKRK